MFALIRGSQRQKLLLRWACAGSLSWAVAMSLWLTSDQAAHQWRILHHLRMLTRSGRVEVVVSTPQLPELRQIVQQVRLDGLAVSQSAQQWEPGAVDARVRLEVPMRPVGNIEVRLAGLDAQGCICGTGIAHSSGAGEETIELHAKLLPLAVPHCGTRLPTADVQIAGAGLRPPPVIEPLVRK